MRQYISSIARAITQSFYKPEVYREAIISEGYGGKYLAVVAVILAAMLAINFSIMLDIFGREELPHITKQLPEMTIDKGKITVNGKEPVNISSKSGKMKIIINTKASENDLRSENIQMGVGKDFIFIKNPNGAYEHFNTAKIKEKVILNQQVVEQEWHNKIILVKLGAVPLLWIGQFIDLIVHCVIVAFLTYVVTAFMQEEYDFLTRMRLAALALTPAEIIATFLKAGFNHQVESWFVILLACLYFYVMVVLMRRLPPQVKVTA